MENLYEVVAYHNDGNQALIENITHHMQPSHGSIGIGRDGSVEWTWEFNDEGSARSLVTMLVRVVGLEVELYRHEADHSSRLSIDGKVLTAA
jgi:hypothetical protein